MSEEQLSKEEREKREKRDLFLFNIVSEAKMYAFVEMAKRRLPPDQVKQYCEAMLERALKAKGVA